MIDIDIFQINEQLKNSDKHLFERINSLIKCMGFDYCIYGVKTIYATDTEIKLLSNYQKEWQNIYSENNYLNIDPVVKHAFHSTQPLPWDGQMYNENMKFWGEAKEFNIERGFSYPLRDLSGRIGVLTFSGSSNTFKDIIHYAPVLSWISQLTHNELANILLPKNEQEIHLTDKEKDVLRFTIEGKTAAEISESMFISESGVNYHFVNIFRKMSVKNKVEAISKALLFNLLY